MGRHALQSRRHQIRPANPGIAKDLDCAAVVIGEQRFEEIADGVLTEIWRKISDAKTAQRGRIISEPWCHGAARFGDNILAPPAVRVKNVFSVHVTTVLKISQ